MSRYRFICFHEARNRINRSRRPILWIEVILGPLQILTSTADSRIDNNVSVIDFQVHSDSAPVALQQVHDEVSDQATHERHLVDRPLYQLYTNVLERLARRRRLRNEHGKNFNNQCQIIQSSHHLPLFLCQT